MAQPPRWIGWVPGHIIALATGLQLAFLPLTLVQSSEAGTGEHNYLFYGWLTYRLPYCTVYGVRTDRCRSRSRGSSARMVLAATNGKAAPLQANAAAFRGKVRST